METIQGSGNKVSNLKDEMLTKLNDILKRKMSREEVANWASMNAEKYIYKSNLSNEDKLLWRHFDIVSGIDLKSSPTKYLHSEDEIHEWIEKIEHDFKPSKD